ncbi:MAG: Bax inhibitor-1/YccA family protein [Opitutales bacterium]|nr:Bax inhibitor-1/YccA family protein [Opitutales bacterium]
MKEEISRSNPVFQEQVFRSVQSSPFEVVQVMTASGVCQKTFILLGLLLMTAAFAWFRPCPPEALCQQIILFSLVAFGLCIAVRFCPPQAARIIAPLYALTEGFVFGAISRIAELRVPGVVSQAALSTVAVLAVMLFMYRRGIIQPTQRFTLVVFSATVAIAITYLLSALFSAFGGGGFSFLHGNSLLGVGVSAVVCVVAALNLILDFGFIENQIKNGAPKEMEWIATLGLFVTLLWIYIEVLELLTKLHSRD